MADEVTLLRLRFSSSDSLFCASLFLSVEAEKALKRSLPSLCLEGGKETMASALYYKRKESGDQYVNIHGA